MWQGSVNALHNTRLAYIKASMPEYEVVEIWEHECDIACKDNLHLKEYLRENMILAPINLRDALFGGRTVKLYFNCKPGEQIMYFQPRIITENFDPNFKYFGLIRCKILS